MVDGQTRGTACLKFSTASRRDVFVYTGDGGEIVPDDVVRVRVDPSVTSIPVQAFLERQKLADVELCEGLVEIGEGSFENCRTSIKKINIPDTLKRICDYAFSGSVRCPICLHDGIERIGAFAFSRCIFTNFRVPPLITSISMGMFSHCRSMFSLELSHNATEINKDAFYYCICLRNVAFPPDAVFDDDIFGEQSFFDDVTDLQKLFGSIECKNCKRAAASI